MLYLGADHGGYELKEILKGWLTSQGIAYEDLGADHLDPDDDYPQVAHAVATAVTADPAHQGILLCRSGGGMVIAANKHRGIRAVAVGDQKAAVHAREHNDANIISLAADWMSEDQAKAAVAAFVQTPFSEEPRHQRRIAQLEV